MNGKINIVPIAKWLKGAESPLIIAGPCSAENEKQLITTAHQLKDVPYVKIFRCGVWKPRTRPGSFEGAGNKALPWLKRVREETGLKIAVEVALPAHVEKSLKYDIDVLWVGARTVVNPFSIQELAASLQNTDLPLLIKNPVIPDLDLWIGAIERFYEAGLNKIVAVHRGFTTYTRTHYRNNPLWEIPEKLKQAFPNLPVICDPSHISGNYKYITEISEHALSIGMSGLMIESHYEPQNALTDSEQQITPVELGKMLDKIISH